MIVKQAAIAVDERDDLVSKVGAPCHPLEVGTSAMLVGTIKAAAREGVLDPAECGFVPYVHPESDLCLAAIATEVRLAHEESDQKPHGEGTRSRISGRGAGFHTHAATVVRGCVTVMFPVKQGRRFALAAAEPVDVRSPAATHLAGLSPGTSP